MSASGNRQVVWKDGVGIYENAKCAVGGQVILLGRSIFFAKEAGAVFDGAFVDLCSRAFDSARIALHCQFALLQG